MLLVGIQGRESGRGTIRFLLEKVALRIRFVKSFQNIKDVCSILLKFAHKLVPIGSVYKHFSAKVMF